MQECAIKAVGEDEIIVNWVDGSGNKFGKLLSSDKVFKTQQHNPGKTKKIVFSLCFCVLFLIGFLIFAIGVSEQYENLKEVKFVFILFTLFIKLNS